MRPEEWIKRRLLALVILAASSAPLMATPLDKAACSALVTELETLVSTGLRDDIERGPEWAKKNLPDERVRSALRLLEIEDQIEFRCHKRYWPSRPEQTAIPLPKRAPASIRPQIAQEKPLSPPNVGAENKATDLLIAPQPGSATASRSVTTQPSAAAATGQTPAALSAATDPAIKVPAQAPELAPLVSAPERPAKSRDKAKRSTLPPESLAADRSKRVAALSEVNTLKNNDNDENVSPMDPTPRAVDAGTVRAFKPAGVRRMEAGTANGKATGLHSVRLTAADDPFIAVPEALGAASGGPSPAAQGLPTPMPARNKTNTNAQKNQEKNENSDRAAVDAIEAPVAKPAISAEKTSSAAGSTQSAAPSKQSRRSASRGYVAPAEVTPYALPGMRF